MPNRQAKLDKRTKRLLNEKLNRLGRTSKQVKRKRAKQLLKQSNEPNIGVRHGR